MATNKYEDMSALDAINFAKNRSLLLPDIQREYVWEYWEIEALFESIVDDYPVGSCIFWKTNRTNLNNEKPNLYYFITKFEKGKTKNDKAPEVFSEENDYYVVLDGQQRITSINIALNGSYSYFKGGKGNDRKNPKNWLEKELYYNLDFYSKKEDNDEKPEKRFCFLTKDEALEGNYYRINQLLAFDKLTDYILDLNKKGYDNKCINDLSMLFNRLHEATANSLIHYYCITENSYDSALDIFVRVNSTGHKLTKSDLLFSTLIDGWKEGKENIEKILAIMNNKGDGFNFSRDYLMRLCLVLVDADTNLKIKSLDKKTIDNIRANWKTIHKTLDVLSTLLAEIGVCNENLTSYNATMPLAYYIYKGGKFKYGKKCSDENKKSKEEARKFLSVALAKRLFGVASNDALNQTRNTLKDIDCKKTLFSLSLFKNITLTGNRKFTVDESDIDYWLDNYVKGPNTFYLLSLLYPDLKLSQYSFHQDHCHPDVAFDDKNIKVLNLSDDKKVEWQKKRNLLPNLQFLKGDENESKNKTPLIEWINEGNTIDYCPNTSYELKNFDDFFTKRRELIKNELKKIFDVK